MPLIGSTITPIVVFLPLITITGVTGTFFRALAVTMSVSLLTSLALALTWTPTLSQYFIHRRKARSPTPRRSRAARRRVDPAIAGRRRGLAGRLLPQVMDFYERWLRRALANPWWLAALSLVLIVVAYVCYRYPARDLLPAMDEGGFILDYIMPAGSSLAETNRMIAARRADPDATPEVESTSRRTGLELGLAAVTEANTGDIPVKLKQDRSRAIDEVIAEVRAKSQTPRNRARRRVHPGAAGHDRRPDQRARAGRDQAVLPGSRAAGNVGAAGGRRASRKITGVVDVLDGIENTISGPAVVFQVDPSDRGARRLHAEELALDATAMLRASPRRRRSSSTTAPTRARPLSRQQPRVAGSHAATRC